MTSLFARHALLPAGWAENVRVEIGADGRIGRVEAGARPAADDLTLGDKTLLPAPANLHSHAFQRAMAGLAERRGAGEDSFWTWRETMYGFLAALDPDDVEAIAAYAFMEMAEAGYGAVGEFHYLHRRPDGGAYDDIAEMSARLIAASSSAGLGLTLLPVFYAYGGVRAAPLEARQRRFASTIESYELLRQAIAKHAKAGLADVRVGTAFHSLRAVSPDAIRVLTKSFSGEVFHIHAAEQAQEVDEVKSWLGARPVEWLLANAPVGRDWCLVHATQMNEAETAGLARSGAVAGLCPLTEADLGDGIFNGEAYFKAGGRFGVGTDSNVAISLAGELRLLEYSQRLALRRRNIFAGEGASTGRTLYEAAAEGGAGALGRGCGRIEDGASADLLTLDPSRLAHAETEGDFLLDAFVFAGGESAIADVWSAGRHIVRQGRHVRRDEIASRFRGVIARLRRGPSR